MLWLSAALSHSQPLGFFIIGFFITTVLCVPIGSSALMFSPNSECLALLPP